MGKNEAMKEAVVASAAKVRRGNRVIKRAPGRPAAVEASALSKERIVATALQLSKEVPLQDISIVRIAREVGATPALMHYYLGGRNALTSGVMNGFFRELVSVLPSHTGEWRPDLAAFMRRIYAEYVRNRGIVAYVMAHNRYRLLQDTAEGEVDFGMLFFDRLISCVRQTGLNSDRTAMFSHLLLQHALSMAYQQVHHQVPGDHQTFLMARLGKLSSDDLPNVRFVHASFSALTGYEAFEAGLKIILDAIQMEVSSGANTSVDENPVRPMKGVELKRISPSRRGRSQTG